MSQRLEFLKGFFQILILIFLNMEILQKTTYGKCSNKDDMFFASSSPRDLAIHYLVLLGCIVEEDILIANLHTLFFKSMIFAK